MPRPGHITLIATPLPRARRMIIGTGLGAIAAPAVLRIIPANAQSKVIKIGHVSPRTGALAGFGEADGSSRTGARHSRADCRAACRTYQVQYHQQGQPISGSRASEVASELILGDKVDLHPGGVGHSRHHQPGRPTRPRSTRTLHHHHLSLAAVFLRGRKGDPAKGLPGPITSSGVSKMSSVRIALGQRTNE